MSRIGWILLIVVVFGAPGPGAETHAGGAVPQPSAPTVQQIMPHGWSIGESVEVLVLGDFLDEAHEVWFEEPGIRGEVVKSSFTSATLRVSSDAFANPGLYSLLLRTARGETNKFHFRLTGWKSLLEREPNDSVTQAQFVGHGSVINGMIEDINDSDFYRIQTQEGETLAFNVLMGRNGYSRGGPVGNVAITLLDARGQAVARNYSRFIWDPYLQHRFAEAGEYYLVVDHSRLAVSCNQGCENQRLGEAYQISIGRSPVLWSLWPPAATPGSVIEAELTADFIEESTPLLFSGDGVEGVISKRLTDTGRYAVKIAVTKDAKPGTRYLTTPDQSGNFFPLPFLVRAGELVIENEPNDDLEKSQPITVPKTIVGKINQSRDVDSFLFQADEGDPLVFELDARKLGSAMLDPHLALLAADGGIIEINDDHSSFSNARNRDARLELSIPFAPNCAQRSDRFFIQVRDTSKHYGDGLFYLLTARRQTPVFELGSSAERIFLQAGGTTSIPVSIRRAGGFQGAVSVSVSGLPAGVTTQPLRIPSTQTAGNLELSAAETARETSAPLHLTASGRMEEKDVTVAAVLPQVRPGDGFAYVPAEPGTLSLHVVAPILFALRPYTDGRDNRTRISLSGSRTSELMFRILRREGFTAPLKMSVEGLPEGVTVEDQHFSEEGRVVHVRLKAMDGAAHALGEHRISVIGSGTSDDGKRVREGTPALMLVIEE